MQTIQRPAASKYSSWSIVSPVCSVFSLLFLSAAILLFIQMPSPPSSPCSLHRTPTTTSQKTLRVIRKEHPHISHPQMNPQLKLSLSLSSFHARDRGANRLLLPSSHTPRSGASYLDSASLAVHISSPHLHPHRCAAAQVWALKHLLSITG